MELIQKHFRKGDIPILTSIPTWPVHNQLCNNFHFDHQEYRYYDP